MIRTYAECDAPACDVRVIWNNLALLPPGWLRGRMSDIEEWYEPPIDRDFCSVECVTAYAEALAETIVEAKAATA